MQPCLKKQNKIPEFVISEVASFLLSISVMHLTTNRLTTTSTLGNSTWLTGRQKGRGNRREREKEEEEGGQRKEKEEEKEQEDSSREHIKYLSKSYHCWLPLSDLLLAIPVNSDPRGLS